MYNFVVPKDIFFLFFCFCIFFCSLASSGMGVFSDASMLILEEDAMQASNISQALNKVNPLYATILGQPFEGHQGMHNSLDS